MKGADICQAVADQYGVTLVALTGPSRMPHLVEARSVAALFMRNLLKYSCARIGALLNRDHSTIWHGLARIRARMAADKDLAFKIANLSLPIIKTVSRETFSTMLGISPPPEHEARP